jgi:hypothetical protein
MKLRRWEVVCCDRDVSPSVVTVGVVPALLRRSVAAGLVVVGESPGQIRSGGLAAAPSDVALPAEGATFERQSYCMVSG